MTKVYLFLIVLCTIITRQAFAKEKPALSTIMFRKCFLLLALASLVMFAACGDKSGEPETGSLSKETTAEFDNSNFGLYKGTIVGSSGTVKIAINNGNSELKATIVIDGQSDVLTSNSTVAKGQAINNVVFNGQFSSLTFSVGADGKNPIIVSISISGHENAAAVVVKETSANVVSVYEGTYSGGAGGVFNLVLC